MNLTYRELLKALNAMTEEQKDTNVTVYVENEMEFYPVKSIRTVDETETDIVDEGHMVLFLA